MADQSNTSSQKESTGQVVLKVLLILAGVALILVVGIWLGRTMSSESLPEGPEVLPPPPPTDGPYVVSNAYINMRSGPGTHTVLRFQEHPLSCWGPARMEIGGRSRWRPPCPWMGLPGFPRITLPLTIWISCQFQNHSNSMNLASPEGIGLFRVWGINRSCWKMSDGEARV